MLVDPYITIHQTWSLGVIVRGGRGVPGRWGASQCIFTATGRAGPAPVLRQPAHLLTPWRKVNAVAEQRTAVN